MNPINTKYLNIYIFLSILLVPTVSFSQSGGYWPPNDQEGAAGGRGGARSLSLIIEDKDSDSILFFNFNSFDELKKSQQSFNIKLGANYNVVTGQEGPSLSFDNNFFLSLSLSSRPLSFTFLDDFLNAIPILDSAVPGAARDFVFIKQTKYYWEPELALSFASVESQGTADLTYLDIFPLVFKRNFGMNFSLGAGIGASALLNGEDDDRGLQLASLLKATYYFNSPWHAELRYSFRQLELAGVELPLNTFQLGIGYTINGGEGEELFKRGARPSVDIVRPSAEN